MISQWLTIPSSVYLPESSRNESVHHSMSLGGASSSPPSASLGGESSSPPSASLGGASSSLPLSASLGGASSSLPSSASLGGASSLPPSASLGCASNSPSLPPSMSLGGTSSLPPSLHSHTLWISQKILLQIPVLIVRLNELLEQSFNKRIDIEDLGLETLHLLVFLPINKDIVIPEISIKSLEKQPHILLDWMITHFMYSVPVGMLTLVNHRVKTPLGRCSYGFTNNISQIYNVCVDIRVRGMGLARKLIKTLLELPIEDQLSMFDIDIYPRYYWLSIDINSSIPIDRIIGLVRLYSSVLLEGKNGVKGIEKNIEKGIERGNFNVVTKCHWDLKKYHCENLVMTCVPGIFQEMSWNIEMAHYLLKQECPGPLATFPVPGSYIKMSPLPRIIDRIYEFNRDKSYLLRFNDSCTSMDLYAIDLDRIDDIWEEVSIDKKKNGYIGIYVGNKPISHNLWELLLKWYILYHLTFIQWGDIRLSINMISEQFVNIPSILETSLKCFREFVSTIFTEKSTDYKGSNRLITSASWRKYCSCKDRCVTVNIENIENIENVCLSQQYYILGNTHYPSLFDMSHIDDRLYWCTKWTLDSNV